MSYEHSLKKCPHGFNEGFCILCKMERTHKQLDEVLKILGADIEK